MDEMRQVSQQIRLESSAIRADVNAHIDQGTSHIANGELQGRSGEAFEVVRCEFAKSIDSISETLEELSALINRVADKRADEA